ncbi:DUF7309 domain-containing protein [Paradesulfitobacterium aromaticivorans]
MCSGQCGGALWPYRLIGYLGAEGLNQILGLLSDEIDPEDHDNMFRQKCLMCSFEDRSTLATEDLKIVKDLGLKFRGKWHGNFFRWDD